MRAAFTPFNFQAPLAAGGVSLMAFNWLQFAVPHGEGPVRLSDIEWAGIAAGRAGLYGLLVAIMAVMTVANLLLTAVFLGDLVRWLAVGNGYREFMSGPVPRITGIFVPVASLAMTMAVTFASAPFFIPAVSANVQALVLPGLVFFAVLWLALFALESRVLRSWLGRPIDTSKLNFVWLLDVFAFGLVALAGTGLALAAAARGVAAGAALASLPVLGAGSILLVVKLAYLARAQARSRALPEAPMQPAFFLLVPITCLYGVSYYRMLLYAQKWFGLEAPSVSRALITFSYIAAVAWIIFTLYLLVGYFRDYFRRSEYFPTQWAMV